jgi:hypothetical protein
MSNVDGRIIACQRKNLTLIENDAKEMRKSHQNQDIHKAADLSLGALPNDNDTTCNGHLCSLCNRNEMTCIF